MGFRTLLPSFALLLFDFDIDLVGLFESLPRFLHLLPGFINFLLGLFSKRANSQGVRIAIIVCIIFTAYAFLTSTKIGLGENKILLLDMGKFNFTHDKLMLGVYSHLIVIIVGYFASLFFPKPVIDKNLLYSGWREQVKKDKKIAAEESALLVASK